MMNTNEQQKILNELKKITEYSTIYGIKQDLLITYDNVYGERHKVNDEWFLPKPIAYRTVLWNEILFDLDFQLYNNYNELIKSLNILCQFLDENHITYYAYASGGKGYHVSVFYDFSQYTHLLSTCIMRLLIYDDIIKSIQKQYGIKIKTDIIPLIYDECTLGRLVRMEGAKHEEKHTYKTLINHMLPLTSHYTCANPRNVILPPCLHIQQLTPQYANAFKLLSTCIKQQELPKTFKYLPPFDLTLPTKILEYVNILRKTGELDNEGRLAVLTHMLANGFKDKEIHEVFKYAKNYDYHTTQYQIDFAKLHNYHPKRLR